MLNTVSARKFIVSLFVLAAAFVGVSCTPEEVAFFNSLPDHKKQAVIDYINSENESRDCNEAIDRHFSGNKEKMKRVVWKESTNNPRAQNARSSAAGCSQMLKIHAHRFNAVGCSWAQRYNADCNIKAADHLYREQGWRPWALTV